MVSRLRTRLTNTLPLRRALRGSRHWVDRGVSLVVSTGALVVLGAMALLTYVVDFAASAFGAKRFGASRQAVIGAVIGAVVGLFFGLVGVIIGPFIGAVAGELSVRLDLEAASRAGVGATIGLALGAAAKLAMAFAMLGIFLIFRFF